MTATTKALGANDATAHQIGDGVDMGISLGSAGVGLMQNAVRGTAVVADDALVIVKNSREVSSNFKTHGVNIDPFSISEGRTLMKELKKQILTCH